MLSGKVKLVMGGLVWVGLALSAPLSRAAPPPQAVTCAENYTVQSGDWLSTIAQKYYGDVLAYPVIVNATNLAAQEDEKYVVVTDPNAIEVGQVLCIPVNNEAEAMLNEPVARATLAEALIPADQMLLIVGNRTLENMPATVKFSGGQFGEAGETFTLEPGQEIRFELEPGDYTGQWTSADNSGFGRKFTAWAGRVVISWVVPETDVVYAEQLDPGALSANQMSMPSVTTTETDYVAPEDGKSLLAVGNHSRDKIPSVLTIFGGKFGEGQEFVINPAQEVMIALAPGDYRATWTYEIEDEPLALSRDFTVTGGKVGVVWIIPEDKRGFLQRPGEPGEELIPSLPESNTSGN